MGAMQAQDLEMAKWAVGVRLPGSTAAMVQTALDNAEIIRTHLLRPTWHLVSADDIYWLLALTAPRVKAKIRSRHATLGLSETVIQKSNAVIENALRGGNHLTREQLDAVLEKANISTGEYRDWHFFLRAELDGIMCSGASVNGKQTFELLEERVPKTKPLSREESIAKLAKIYFTSHGPATVQDFTWWSGLPVSDVKSVLEMPGAGFVPETVGAQKYWHTGASTRSSRLSTSVYLLPAFDEFFISYADRSALLVSDVRRKLISSNGIFRPIVLFNGQAVGKWKRTIVKDTVTLEVEYLKNDVKIPASLIKESVARFGDFLNKKIEFIVRN